MRGVTDKLIVLSSLKYGDTSLIVKAFTYQFGVLSFMLKGVRKRRGGLIALYQPASVLEANIVYREGKSLHGINQPKHVFVAHKTTAELQRMAKALFISEYLQNILIQESPNEELFTLSVDWLSALEHDDSNEFHHLRFLCASLQPLGIRPRIPMRPEQIQFDLREGIFSHVVEHRDVLHEEEAALFLKGLEWRFDHLSSLQRWQLLHHLLDYVRVHLPWMKSIKTLDVMKQVFTETSATKNI